MSKTTVLMVALIGVLLLVVNTWFWVAVIPEQAMKLHKIYADQHPPVEQYDCYEYHGDYDDADESDWHPREYGPGTAEDTDMPGPQLECEAGDHACID